MGSKENTQNRKRRPRETWDVEIAALLKGRKLTLKEAEELTRERGRKAWQLIKKCE